MRELHPIFSAKTVQETALYLEAGVDPNLRTTLGLTPLCFAQSCEQALLLIKHGANVNGNSLTTPLHNVSSLQVMKTLIENGANVNKQDKFNETPIFKVTTLDQAKLLIENGAKLEVFNIFKTSPLHYLNNLQLAKYYIEIGVNLNLHLKDSFYPMETITNVEILKLFLLHGGVIPYRKSGNLFTHNTTNEQILLYLKAGANPHMVNKYGRTPLFYATNLDTVTTLIKEYKVNPNKQDCLGRTPLFLAQDKDMINFYLEQPKIKKDIQDNIGCNPLHTQKTPESLYAFALAGFDLNKQDKYGNTPLHYHMNSVDKIRCLLLCGANPNISNKEGITPLSMCDSKQLLSLLFYSGADLSFLNSKDIGPWDEENDEIKKFIEAKKISMSIFNNFTPQVSKDDSPEKNIPPDLIEPMKSGNYDYFEAMLDIYGTPAMMKDIFHYLLNEQNYLFCRYLLEENKIPKEEYKNLTKLIKKQQLNSSLLELLDLIEKD